MLRERGSDQERDSLLLLPRSQV
uniref:Uncharacterized protein n=1 Tax=Anguilla anguilla TaxID=7936 RepID=A0A0E9RQK2_ANGAN